MPRYDLNIGDNVEMQTWTETAKHVKKDAPAGVRRAVASGGFCPPHWEAEMVVAYRTTVTARVYLAPEQALSLQKAGKVRSIDMMMSGRDIRCSVEADATGIGSTTDESVRSCADQFDRLGFDHLATHLRQRYLDV